MITLLPAVAVLQIFCLYHAHRHHADHKWYWLIIFFPAIGGGFYLYDHFYNRKNLASISEGFKGIINSNYEIEKLEQQLRHTESEQNRTHLADKYLAIGRLQDAIELYQSCIKGTTSDSTDVLMSLVEAQYQNENYAEAVQYAETIVQQKEFKKSNAKVAYAWSLYHMNELEKAEATFIDLDSRFTHYPQRLEYAKFLNALEREHEAIEYLDELLEEFEQMQTQERREKRSQWKAVQSYRQELSKQLLEHRLSS